ncbi:histidine kinase dimerization/phosphoacceptor domain -containing protein [Azospirillum sp. ST 5-10]|uniref:histidine kinase dimerization/phosphoacceptor domain -containing protein n=1 Tax=unclassified Azospirillum TaxID=2630922 RepID=UPI003F4A2A86
MSERNTPNAGPGAAAAPSDGGLDLTACDREPIHVPGSIQPHGLLLVAERATRRIVGGAGALEERLAAPWLHRTLDELLGPGLADAACRRSGGGPAYVGQVQGAAERFDAVASAADDRILVELEPAAASSATAAEVLADIDEVGAAFERAADLADLCARAATAFRRLTGFDRVMIYRFHEDGAGEVVAEDADAGVPSFLNHHFPASDIPRQARGLYVRNRVRVIPDVAYAPAPLRPAAAGLADLDLSDVALRSVSPVHLQYLKNMGVAASASVSIVTDGVLWGLVACHHWTAKPLPHAARALCRTLAGGFARQIRAKEDARLHRERVRVRAAEDEVVGHLAVTADLRRFLDEASDRLRLMLDGDGFAALHGADLHLGGRHPEPERLRAIAAWIAAQAPAPVFSTSALPEAFPPARDDQALASGVLAVAVPAEVPILFLWFRAERVEVVNWAGNPHKPAAVGPAGQLTPRGSFAAWSETVRGRSRPWTLVELEAARRLARVFLEARQNQRIRELNRQLAATNTTNEHLLRQKECLIGEVNHRVKNSLQMVSAFLGMQAKGSGDAAVVRELGEAQSRIAAIALVHRRLYVDENVEIIDLARYLEEICADMRSSLGEEWRSAFSLDLSPVLIATNLAANVGLILTELIINATKYAYGGRPGPVRIRLEQHHDRFRLTVADAGTGKAGGKEGFGTRMLRTLVRHIRGTLEEHDDAPGLRTVVTAPVA